MARHEAGGYAAVLGGGHRAEDPVFAVDKLLVLAAAALQVGVVALRGEDAVARKAALLELAVGVSGDYEPLFPFDKWQQPVI